MLGQLVLLGRIDPQTAVAVGTIALAVVGIATLCANYFVLKETKKQAQATREAADASLEEAKQVASQVRASWRQAKLAEGQLTAINEQAIIARTALRLQIAPRLIPGGAQSCRIGEPESIMRPPQEITVQPVFLGVVNAGNGVAIIDTASAQCGPDGGRGGMGVIAPPALAGGAEDEVKLTPQIGDAQKHFVGMLYAVTILYHGDGGEPASQELRFTAQYFSSTHWDVHVTETRPEGDEIA